MASTSWFPSGQSEEDRNRQLFVAVIGLRAFKAADEIEGMITGEGGAPRSYGMQPPGYVVPDQPFEAAQGFRKAAANASRTFVELLWHWTASAAQAGNRK